MTQRYMRRMPVLFLFEDILTAAQAVDIISSTVSNLCGLVSANFQPVGVLCRLEAPACRLLRLRKKCTVGMR